MTQSEKTVEQNYVEIHRKMYQLTRPVEETYLKLPGNEQTAWCLWFKHFGQNVAELDEDQAKKFAGSYCMMFSIGAEYGRVFGAPWGNK